MTEKLKPLTAKEAEEFGRRRESKMVLQIRCECGQWFETPKRERAFEESVGCICGRTLRYWVPKAEYATVITMPSNEEILSALDPDARLDTGMKVKEAIRRAAGWWEGSGRKLMKLKGMSKTAFATLDTSSENYNPSGLLAGLEWSALTKREKLMVVKTYHHFSVRKPDIIGGEGDTHRVQNRHTIQ